MAAIKFGNCKVCNSYYRNIIETLSVKGFDPQKIYEYLQSLTDPEDIERVKAEGIKPSHIRKHIQSHFDSIDNASIIYSEIQQKIDKTREKYNRKETIVVDKVNLIAMEIDTLLIKMKGLDEYGNEKIGHELTLKYMSTIKSLVETLAKLTGDLKQEGTIDINFFGTEITKFSELIILCIRRIDRQLEMQGTLENLFAEEFKKQYTNYLNLQNKKINRQIDINEGNYSINTFNETDL